MTLGGSRVALWVLARAAPRPVYQESTHECPSISPGSTVKSAPASQVSSASRAQPLQALTWCPSLRRYWPSYRFSSRFLSFHRVVNRVRPAASTTEIIKLQQRAVKYYHMKISVKKRSGQKEDNQSLFHSLSIFKTAIPHLVSFNSHLEIMKQLVKWRINFILWFETLALLVNCRTTQHRFNVYVYVVTRSFVCVCHCLH